VITIGGVDIREQSTTELRRGIGYVIQQIGLFPHRTIAQNIATVPTLLGWDKGRTTKPSRRAGRAGGHRPDDAEALPRRAVGRPAAARRRRPRPGCRSRRCCSWTSRSAPWTPSCRAHLQGELLALQARVHKTIVLVTHDIDEAVLLGDRVAVLNVGGILEQVAAPDDLLAHPANEFVGSFVGNERGIKRLSLATVSELALEPGPVVDRSASVDEVRTALTRSGLDWLGVTERGQLQGWLPADAVEAALARADGIAPLADAALEPVVARLQPTSSLRAALEVILTARSSTALVADADGTYLGSVTLETIRSGLAS
jgi:osmoprotectant transport system ATP-binding protein